ncbi:MAG: GNAT family protein [Clostridia bacterium]
MLRLRPYRESDAETIVSWVADERVLRQWSANLLGAFPPTSEGLNAYYRKEANAALMPFTAFDENGVAGHFFLCLRDADMKIARVGLVIVDGEKRGKGYGKELLALAKAYAFGLLKAERMTLGVFENNAQARHCYRACGFRQMEGELRTCQFENGELWNCFDMEALKA